MGRNLDQEGFNKDHVPGNSTKSRERNKLFKHAKLFNWWGGKRAKESMERKIPASVERLKKVEQAEQDVQQSTDSAYLKWDNEQPSRSLSPERNLRDPSLDCRASVNAEGPAEIPFCGEGLRSQLKEVTAWLEGQDRLNSFTAFVAGCTWGEYRQYMLQISLAEPHLLNAPSTELSEDIALPSSSADDEEWVVVASSSSKSPRQGHDLGLSSEEITNAKKAKKLYVEALSSLSFMQTRIECARVDLSFLNNEKNFTNCDTKKQYAKLHKAFVPYLKRIEKDILPKFANVKFKDRIQNNINIIKKIDKLIYRSIGEVQKMATSLDMKPPLSPEENCQADLNLAIAKKDQKRELNSLYFTIRKTFDLVEYYLLAQYDKRTIVMDSVKEREIGHKFELYNDKRKKACIIIQDFFAHHADVPQKLQDDARDTSKIAWNCYNWAKKYLTVKYENIGDSVEKSKNIFEQLESYDLEKLCHATGKLESYAELLDLDERAIVACDKIKDHIYKTSRREIDATIAKVSDLSSSIKSLLQFTTKPGDLWRTYRDELGSPEGLEKLKKARQILKTLKGAVAVLERYAAN